MHSAIEGNNSLRGFERIFKLVVACARIVPMIQSNSVHKQLTIFKKVQGSERTITPSPYKYTNSNYNSVRTSTEEANELDDRHEIV